MTGQVRGTAVARGRRGGEKRHTRRERARDWCEVRYKAEE
jgi:hypothetical protein